MIPRWLGRQLCMTALYEYKTIVKQPNFDNFYLIGTKRDGVLSCRSNSKSAALKIRTYYNRTVNCLQESGRKRKFSMLQSHESSDDQQSRPWPPSPSSRRPWPPSPSSHRPWPPAKPTWPMPPTSTPPDSPASQLEPAKHYFDFPAKILAPNVHGGQSSSELPYRELTLSGSGGNAGPPSSLLTPPQTPSLTGPTGQYGDNNSLAAGQLFFSLPSNQIAGHVNNAWPLSADQQTSSAGHQVAGDGQPGFDGNQAAANQHSFRSHQGFDGHQVSAGQQFLSSHQVSMDQQVSVSYQVTAAQQILPGTADLHQAASACHQVSAGQQVFPNQQASQHPSSYCQTVYGHPSFMAVLGPPWLSPAGPPQHQPNTVQPIAAAPTKLNQTPVGRRTRLILPKQSGTAPPFRLPRVQVVGPLLYRQPPTAPATVARTVQQVPLENPPTAKPSRAQYPSSLQSADSQLPNGAQPMGSSHSDSKPLLLSQQPVGSGASSSLSEEALQCTERAGIFTRLLTESLGTVRRWRENGVTLEVRSGRKKWREIQIFGGIAVLRRPHRKNFK
jgi:hypothetical protein